MSVLTRRTNRYFPKLVEVDQSLYRQTSEAEQQTKRLVQLLFIASFTLVFVNCKSKRTIYTLFTTRKTWNEAKAICESQFGQLAKLETQSDIDEIRYLDSFLWGNTIDNILTTEDLWIGLHKPFSNTTLTYQDCEFQSLSIVISATFAGGACGAFTGTDMDIVVKDCQNTHKFICERNEGDCWFEPFQDYAPGYGLVVPGLYQALDPSLEASECAYECRSRNVSGHECWGFQYDPEQVIGCVLYFMSDSHAQAQCGTSASAVFVGQVNLVPFNDTIFYARRCFEGVEDSETYSSFVDTASSPNTNCSYWIYPGDAEDMEVCFCPTDVMPPIPEPVSSEAKAEELVNALSIDTSNTSAAQRKLISAEDDRPSAIGVGYVGVAMLSTIFGGLLLMDLNLLLVEVKKAFGAIKGSLVPNAETSESEIQIEVPDSTNC